jgi:AraC-like DNA-binding protein
LAEERLAELPEAAATTQRVRVLASRELSGGEPTAEHVASLLHMSRRTLARRLEQEGTSFRSIMDDLRRGLAERYLALDDLGMSEIAVLLGFSDPAAFHRAFRRWCGQSPSEYRREHRLAAADRGAREQSS